MSNVNNKTAGQAWRLYQKAGGTLSFKDFINREKEKMHSANGEDDTLLMIDKSLNDGVQKAIRETLQAGGLKTTQSGKTIFGVNKTLFIAGSLLVAGTIIFLIVQNARK